MTTEELINANPALNGITTNAGRSLVADLQAELARLRDERGGWVAADQYRADRHHPGRGGGKVSMDNPEGWKYACIVACGLILAVHCEMREVLFKSECDAAREYREALERLSNLFPIHASTQ